jgi:hypothetical protein
MVSFIFNVFATLFELKLHRAVRKRQGSWFKALSLHSKFDKLTCCCYLILLSNAGFNSIINQKNFIELDSKMRVMQNFG